MKQNLTLLAILAVTLLLPAAPVLAEGSWKLPNLNPFSSGEETSSSARNRPKPISESKSSWSWPSMNPWGGTTSTARSKPAGPSAWDRMTSAPKNIWSKSKPYLMPWDSAEPPPTRRPLTGSNVMPGYSARKPEVKKGFFDSWFGEEEPDDKPRTVNDFLAQPRPDF